MPNTIATIQVTADLQIRVQVVEQGVVLGKHVDGIYASDLLLTAEQAEQYGKALIEASAKCRGM